MLVCLHVLKTVLYLFLLVFASFSRCNVYKKTRFFQSASVKVNSFFNETKETIVCQNNKTAKYTSSSINNQINVCGNQKSDRSTFFLVYFPLNM